MSLPDENCRSIQPGDRPLVKDEAERLAQEVPDWTLRATAIERTFVFKNFRQAIDFVNRLADYAEKQHHHPDISILYNKVRLTFTTHKIGGLSRNDFILAAKIDRLMSGSSEEK